VENSKISEFKKALKYDALLRSEAWRFLTYMLIHSSDPHIIFNVIVQIFLGVPLEFVHCWWRVAIVYLSGVIAGSLVQSVVKPCTGIVGASGGVYAIITAHVATIILNWHEMKYAALQLFVFMILCTSDVFATVFLEKNENVSSSAHLFGAFAGILVGIGVLRNLRVRPYQKKLWIFCLAIYFVLVLVAICHNIRFVYIQQFNNIKTTKQCKKFFQES
jgi:rhomboid-related protein 1/2/3